MMQPPWKTTFHVLRQTENDAAVPVLLAGLDARDPQVQQESLRALLDRRSVTGQREIVRRLHRLPAQWKPLLEQRRARLESALRDALLGEEEQSRHNAYYAVVWLRQYDLLPVLLTLLESPQCPEPDRVGQTLLHLAGRLDSDLHGMRNYKDRRDPFRLRHFVLGALEKSLQRWPQHQRDEVIESFLILAPRDHVLLRRILSDPFHPCYLKVLEFLTHSKREPILRLLLSFLENPTAPSAALQTLARRTDPEFLQYLLSKIGYQPSKAAAANLRRIERIAWADPQQGVLDQLSEAHQYSAVQMLIRSRVPRQQVFRALKHLLQHGHPAGRRAAVQALAEFSGAEANQLVLQALQDPDPQVQAAAVSQVRRRNIPGALSILVEALDSPLAPVRRAAAAALPEFQFSRYLGSFDTLDDVSRESTGRMVVKVDPQALVKLRQEMQAKARSRRLRAVEMALAMGVVPQVQGTLIQLLQDEDHLVRVEAVEALALGEGSEVDEALQRALHDPSVLVQDAARGVLQRRAASGQSAPFDEGNFQI